MLTLKSSIKLRELTSPSIDATMTLSVTLSPNNDAIKNEKKKTIPERARLGKLIRWKGLPI